MMNFDKEAVKLYIKELASNQPELKENENKALELSNITPKLYEGERKNGRNIGRDYKLIAASILAYSTWGKEVGYKNDQTKIWNYHNENYVFKGEFSDNGYPSYLTLRKIARLLFRKLKTKEINNAVSSIF